MKKEIMNLLNNTNEEAYFRINNISYLRRWTKDALTPELTTTECRTKFPILGVQQ